MKIHKLFVYGILLDTHSSKQPAVLKGFKKIIKGHATIIKDDKSYVNGQIIEINDDEFKRIDEIEGFPYYYDRFKTKVKTPKGIEVAWVYHMVNHRRQYNDKRKSMV